MTEATENTGSGKSSEKQGSRLEENGTLGQRRGVPVGVAGENQTGKFVNPLSD